MGQLLFTEKKNNHLLSQVEEYLRVYYGSDDQTATKNIKNDYELQNLVKELRQNGRVGWLNNFDNSMKFLAEVVSSVIFTASAQHAAVNFPQDQILSYVPAFPAANFKAPPGKLFAFD
jgi:arachidonate 15-lipoxygenase